MALPKRPARILDVTDTEAATRVVVESYLRAGFRVTPAADASIVQLELGNPFLPVLLAPLAVLPGRAGRLGVYARVLVERRGRSQLVIGLAAAFLANDVVPVVVAAMEDAVAVLGNSGLLESAGPVISVRDVPPIVG